MVRLNETAQWDILVDLFNRRQKLKKELGAVGDAIIKQISRITDISEQELQDLILITTEAPELTREIERGELTIAGAKRLLKEQKK